MKQTCLMIGVLLACVGGCKDPDAQTAAAKLPEVVFLAGQGVSAGRIAVDRQGVATLPENMASASFDRKAYVKGDANSKVILLLEKFESPTSFKGYARISPAPESKPETVDVLVPGDAKPQLAKAKIVKDYAEGWYGVEAAQ